MSRYASGGYRSINMILASRLPRSRSKATTYLHGLAIADAIILRRHIDRISLVADPPPISVREGGDS